MSKQIIVIGGGPAGIEAARSAAQAGAEVTLVSNAPLGGRAGWHSLLPSKVWLNTADLLALFLEAGRTAQQPALPTILERIRQVKQSWNSQQETQLQGLGVRLISGRGVFAGTHDVAIVDDAGETGQTLSADAIIVTTGSVPIFPPDMRPNGKQIIAPRFASALDKLPATIAVVGGGATGSEFVYLFNRLGVDVTWIVDEQGVLPDFDRQAAQLLAEIMQERGVTLVAGQRASHIDSGAEGIEVVLADGTRHGAQMAFLAIGRKPDVAQLELAQAGLALVAGAVPVDEYGRSPQPHIYFAGDVTGAPMIANRAMAQAWVAGQHAAGQQPTTFPPEVVIRAIYTAPQVAEVGTLAGPGIVTAPPLPFTASMKTHLLPEQEGFVKVAYGQENGRIRGAVAIGDHAADVIAPLAVAIRGGLTMSEMGVLFGAHPTLSELAFTAARRG